MSDQTCKKCSASITEENAETHAKWHREQDQKISTAATEAASAAVAKKAQDDLRRQRQAGLGGRP